MEREDSMVAAAAMVLDGLNGWVLMGEGRVLEQTGHQELVGWSEAAETCGGEVICAEHECVARRHAGAVTSVRLAFACIVEGRLK